MLRFRSSSSTNKEALSLTEKRTIRFWLTYRWPHTVMLPCISYVQFGGHSRLLHASRSHENVRGSPPDPRGDRAPPPPSMSQARTQGSQAPRCISSWRRAPQVTRLSFRRRSGGLRIKPGGWTSRKATKLPGHLMQIKMMRERSLHALLSAGSSPSINNWVDAASLSTTEARSSRAAQASSKLEG